MPEWLIVAIKEYLFVKETSSSTVMGTTRCLFESVWVQLKKFASLISWPPWLENQQSWIIKIGAEFIIQVSLVLPQRRLHDGHNYLFRDVKISNFKNWFIEVWMSTETGRVTISRFPLTQMNKSRYYKQLWFVLCYKLDGLLLLIYRNVLLLLWKAYVLRPRKSWMGQQVWLNSFLQPCWDW